MYVTNTYPTRLVLSSDFGNYTIMPGDIDLYLPDIPELIAHINKLADKGMVTVTHSEGLEKHIEADAAAVIDTSQSESAEEVEPTEDKPAEEVEPTEDKPAEEVEPVEELKVAKPKRKQGGK